MPLRATAGERFHGSSYLGLQRLRGRPVGRYIRTLQQWERLDRERFNTLCAERRAAMLAYARAQVPLYRGGEWEQALSGRHAPLLRDWPVLERSTVQARAADIMAQPPVRGPLYRSTSGSIGQPLRVAVDPEASAWGWASDYRALLWFGIPVGAKTLMIRPPVDPPWQNWLRNWTLISAFDLSLEKLDAACRMLVRERPALVWGFTSAVVELARHARTVNPPPQVAYVKLMGEMTYPWQRDEIEQSLGARVLTTYGCVELGSAGHECPNGSLHLYSELTDTEILRDGEPVRPGELGDIVLTSLTNRAMPLVRYKVGDLGRLSPDPCACGLPHPVLADIQGRVADVLFAADGTLVHAQALGAGLKQLLTALPANAIAQVLFEQLTRREWRVLVKAGPTYNDDMAEHFVRIVRQYFGDSCGVTVTRVDEIPREPSGKYRYVRGAPSAPDRG